MHEDGMEKKTARRITKESAIAIAAFLIVSAGLAISELYRENVSLKTQVKELRTVLASVTDGLARATSRNADLTNQNSTLATNLQAAQNQNNAFGFELQDLSGTVNTLQKLSATDKELLQKYSKVYFLNENYVPSSLSTIDTQYAYDGMKVMKIHSGVAPFLYSMIAAAARDGVNLRIISAYRSFGEQAAVKLEYTVTYGAGTANQFSADQGYSEHQLGTAIDFTTTQLGANFSKFAASPGYTWLTANAYRFGFILSYPKNNTYYQFEPWHWRFVGVKLATNLHDTNRHFYDLDQREIDQYLISIFD